MKYLIKWTAWAVLGLCVCGPAGAQVDIEGFLKKSDFEDIKISPGGEYFAATVPFEDRTGIVVLRRADSKVMSSFTLGKNNYIDQFVWVNDERLLFTVQEKFGLLEAPQSNGEILAMDYDDSVPETLVGYRAPTGEQLGSHIPKGTRERVAATHIQLIPGDERNVIITVVPYTEDEKWQRADRMDVYSGRRTTVARAPVKGSSFHVDNQGAVRFALGSEYDNASKLYYRDNDQSEWKLINDELSSHRTEAPIGFSEDNRIAYLQVEQASGPDVIVGYAPATGKRTELLRDKLADPGLILHESRGTSAPVGVAYLDGKAHARFFDPEGREARLYQMLQAAFPNEQAFITSATRDGKLVLVGVESDREPGIFYLMDTDTKKADFLVSRKNDVDPDKMARVKPVEITARDGLVMRAYLTLPTDKSDRNLPLVIYPHGGPFGVFDRWGFDTDAQILASAGYAVLQVNYRGSGNYGRAFHQAGAEQWGQAMQDDLTDATRWAIAQGFADSQRICIHGASYGAYASLMGVAKEPDLYRCAAGYVGVYDLVMLSTSQSKESKRLNTWTAEWLGEGEGLAKVSPTSLASQIKVPVFLAAGGEDETAPIAHSEKMEKALRGAGVPVETLYFPTEGHGFYDIAHRREYYTRLLEFLNRNIGPAGSATAGSPASKAN